MAVHIISLAIASLVVLGPFSLVVFLLVRSLRRRFGDRALLEALAIGALPGGLAFLIVRSIARRISEPRRTP